MPSVLLLVSAISVPDHILRAPVGLGVHSALDIYNEYLAAVSSDVQSRSRVAIV
jgi:hypothetical protein